MLLDAYYVCSVGYMYVCGDRGKGDTETATGRPATGLEMCPQMEWKSKLSIGPGSVCALSGTEMVKTDTARQVQDWL